MCLIFSNVIELLLKMQFTDGLKSGIMQPVISDIVNVITMRLS